MAKKAATKKPSTKTELLARIAATTGLARNRVAAVLEAMAAEIQQSLNNSGVITILTLLVASGYLTLYLWLSL